jgi:signal transduction histidine kinase
LGNLLENAAKYSSAGAPIVVMSRVEEVDGAKNAVVRVIDSGIGIPTSDLPRVFERYHRGANVAPIPGEGLGLSSVRALVQLHHGTVDVESREGFGTTITVRLPMP